MKPAPLAWQPSDQSIVVVPKRNAKRAKCSRCGGYRDKPGHRWCRNCHKLYMRDYRKKQAQELKELRELRDRLT